MLQGRDPAQVQQFLKWSAALANNSRDVNALDNRAYLAMEFAKRGLYRTYWQWRAAKDLEAAVHIDPKDFIAWQAPKSNATLGATPRLGTRGLESFNPRPQDLSFSLGMFRDHDVVVSLTRMPAMLIDASLRLVERLVAAKPTARTAPNHVVRPRVLPSLSFHDVLCACLRSM